MEEKLPEELKKWLEEKKSKLSEYEIVEMFIKGKDRITVKVKEKDLTGPEMSELKDRGLAFYLEPPGYVYVYKKD